ncbi:MAG TPA: four helix bundle protein [Bacteroidales bacterium]|nr:four helix bundle protein [Bacteroidales bacterium]HPS27875.1 four helix bundle protein [Bacteroidales bacterium]HQI70553.1 four helix bundle protein [Bacteroidales bacterium]
MSKSIVRDKSFNFAIRVIRLYKFLIDEKKEFVMSKQLLRSGTSIGANLAEQEFAISDADYLNKTSIALKEAAESSYWLDLLHETEYLTDSEYNNIITDCNELIKMLVVSVKTIKTKLGR